jgi:hypothetical protein
MGRQSVDSLLARLEFWGGAEVYKAEAGMDFPAYRAMWF